MNNLLFMLIDFLVLSLIGIIILDFVSLLMDVSIFDSSSIFISSLILLSDSIINIGIVNNLLI